MVFDRYIMINEDRVTIGQNASTGAWYCKDLTTKKEQLLSDGEFVIGVLNKLNSRNNQVKKKDSKKIVANGV